MWHKIILGILLGLLVLVELLAALLVFTWVGPREAVVLIGLTSYGMVALVGSLPGINSSLSKVGRHWPATMLTRSKRVGRAIVVVRVMLVLVVIGLLGWIFSGPAEKTYSLLMSALNWAFFSAVAAGLCVCILGQLSEVMLRSWILSRAPLAGLMFGIMRNQQAIPAGVWGGVMVVGVSILISLGVSLPLAVKWLTRRRNSLAKEFMVGEFQADVSTGTLSGLCLVLALAFASPVS